MVEAHIHQRILELVTGFGDLGVFIGMFLESSIVPIPSEVIIVGAGAMGVPILSILIFGSLGATAGSMAGYFLGRYAATPVILKYGRFVLIKPHHIARAEEFAKKYGSMSVLIGRVLPIVPFKVFSIAAGITKIPPAPFIIWTLVGVVPRILLLAIFGNVVVKYTKPAVLVILALVVLFLAIEVTRRFYKGRKNKARK